MKKKSWSKAVVVGAWIGIGFGALIGGLTGAMGDSPDERAVGLGMGALGVLGGALGASVGAFVWLLSDSGKTKGDASHVHQSLPARATCTTPGRLRADSNPDRRIQFTLKTLLGVMTACCVLLAVGRVFYLEFFAKGEPSLLVLFGVILFLDAVAGTWYGWCASKEGSARPWPMLATPLLVFLTVIGVFLAVSVATGCSEHMIYNTAGLSVLVFPPSCLSLIFCCIRFE